MNSLKRLLMVGIALVVGAASSAYAAPFTIVSGGLKLSAIVDPSFNFAALDLRGSVGLNTPVGTALLTDLFAQAAFGNLALTAIDTAFNGTGARVTLVPSTFSLSNNGAIFMIDSIGSIVNPPLSPPVSQFLSPLLFTFGNPVITALPGTPDVLAQYSLVSVAPAVPEPSAFALGGVALVLVTAYGRRRSKNAQVL